MKKLIAFALAAVMAISMVACSKSAEDETSKPTDKPVNKPSTNESKPAEKPSETKPSTEATKPGNDATDATKPEEAFKEIILVDDENVTVKVVGTEESSLLGYTLKLFIENKTDKELMFSADNVSVNGFMCDPFWAESVDAGKKSNDTMTFLKSDFEKNEITTVEQIKLTLRVYDKNDLTAKDLVNISVTLDF